MENDQINDEWHCLRAARSSVFGVQSYTSARLSMGLIERCTRRFLDYRKMRGPRITSNCFGRKTVHKCHKQNRPPLQVAGRFEVGSDSSMGIMSSEGRQTECSGTPKAIKSSNRRYDENGDLTKILNYTSGFTRSSGCGLGVPVVKVAPGSFPLSDSHFAMRSNNSPVALCANVRWFLFFHS